MLLDRRKETVDSKKSILIAKGHEHFKTPASQLSEYDINALFLKCNLERFN